MAEEDDVVEILLCLDWPGTFPDNVKAPCADCGKELAVRPHAPAHFIRVCNKCGWKRMQENPAENHMDVYEGQRKELEEMAEQYGDSEAGQFLKALLRKTRRH